MPIIPYEERVAIVQAIRFVDQVVPQVTMNKLDAWQTYQFDAMFHGDDWKGSALYNDIEKSLREVGCDLVFLPHTDGTSSTILAQVLNKDLENKE